MLVEQEAGPDDLQRSLIARLSVILWIGNEKAKL